MLNLKQYSQFGLILKKKCTIIVQTFKSWETVVSMFFLIWDQIENTLNLPSISHLWFNAKLNEGKYHLPYFGQQFCIFFAKLQFMYGGKFSCTRDKPLLQRKSISIYLGLYAVKYLLTDLSQKYQICNWIISESIFKCLVLSSKFAIVPD